MKAIISGNKLSGSIYAPPSKSVAHRALFCSALAESSTKVYVGDICGDLSSAIECLSAMGVTFNKGDGFLDITPPRLFQENALFDCGESGATLRFLLPICASLGLNARFIGKGKLPQRPLAELMNALHYNGLSFSNSSLPFDISGKLCSGKFFLPGNVSSQFVSGLLMALPILSGCSEIVLNSPLESKAYVELTLDMLKNFGISVKNTDCGYSIDGNQKYLSPGNMTVEGDWSGVANFLVAGAISGNVSVSGLNSNSIQADRSILDALKNFGAKPNFADSSVSISSAKLCAAEIDVSQSPDLLPILAVLALAADGETTLYNAARLRYKESDRLSATAQFIISLGGRVQELSDGLIIHGSALKGGTVDSCNDHRIAMAAAVSALLCENPVEILGAESVSKSYPRFFEDLKTLGLNCRLSD